MQKIFILVISLFIGWSVSAQNIAITQRSSLKVYVYKISNKQAKKIYKKGYIPYDTLLFHYLVDSFATNKEQPERLPQGHYLFASANTNQLDITLHSENKFEPLVVNNSTDFSMVILSDEGLIEDAKVNIDGKRIHFDKKSHTYRIPKGNPDGIMTIAKEGYVGFFHLKKEFKTNKVLTFLSLSPQKYVWIPIRLVVFSPYDLFNTVRRGRPQGIFYWLWKPVGDAARSIKWGYPQGWVQTVSDLTESISYGDPEPRVQKLWEFFNHSFRDRDGFVLFNQPKYRPNDTLRFKAFVADFKGKTNDKELKLFLDAKDLGKINPYKTGFYESYIVLHDSLNLRLDQWHSIRLENEKGRSVSGTFMLEDYELKNSSFEAFLAMNSHFRGESNEVVCSVDDANGNPISDAKAEVTVLPKHIISQLADEVFLPDTLWHHTQKLDDLAKTQIAIPDSIFPNLTMNYNVQVTLTGENNETRGYTFDGTFNGQSDRIKIEKVGTDSAVARYYKKSKEINIDGWMSTTKLDSTKITYPYYFVPKFSKPAYHFYSEKAIQFLENSEDWSNVTVDASRTDKSLMLSIGNSRKLPITVYLYRGNREILRSTFSSDTVITLPYKNRKACSLYYSYVWAGKIVERNYSIPPSPTSMNVTLICPPNAVPGQVVDIKVAVTSSKGNPIPNADVTAWAFSSKFQGYHFPAFPTFTKESSKQRILRNRFHMQENGIEESEYNLNFNYWHQRMQLDTMEFYKFLYPKNGYYIKSFFTKDSTTLISPFIHRNGQPLYIQQMNLNGWPAMFGLENANRPNVYNALMSNTLEIYDRDSIYFFPDIKIPEKQQTIINIDLKNPIWKHVAVAKSKIKLRDQYLATNSYTGRFESQLQPYYIHQFNHYFLIYPDRNKRLVNIAPFYPSDFEMVSRENSYTIRFEPRYTYTFGPNYIKMKSMATFSKEEVQNSGRQLDWNFNQQLVSKTMADKFIQPEPENPFYSFFKTSYENITGNSFLKIAYHREPNEEDPFAFVLIDQVSRKIMRCDKFSNVLPSPTQIEKPGQYALYLFYLSGIRYLDSINIGNNGTLFLTIERGKIGGKAVKKIDFAQFNHMHIDSTILRNTTKLSSSNIIKIVAQSNAKKGPKGSAVYGTVTSAEDGYPLPGAVVQVVGTNQGCSTDIDGQFWMDNLSNPVMLRFSFVGFNSIDIPSTPGVAQLVIMEPSVLRMEEVVVTAIGVSRKSLSLGYATTNVIYNSLQGKVAGVSVSGNPGAGNKIMLRGFSSIPIGSGPIYVVDGKILTAEEFNRLDKESITSMKVLSGAAATSLYGSRAANGVVLISTKAGSSAVDVSKAMDDSAYTAALAGASTMRTKFKDYAFWMPKLTTDNNGIATFKAKLPDDITTWNTNAVAVSKKLEIGSTQAFIKAFKPAMASLSVPRFLVEGDSIWVRGRVTSYVDEKQHVSRSFAHSGTTQNFPDSLMGKLLVDSTLVVAPSADSISVEYKATITGGGSDGEGRTIPINLIGTKETLGLFALAESDTTVTFPDTLHTKKVKIFASSAKLDLLQSLTESIASYRYLCNEQASSKLIVLLMIKRATEQEGKHFEGEAQIKALIKRLTESRSSSGLWGWWKGSNDVFWITTQVAKALSMAATQGYDMNKINFAEVVNTMKHQLESNQSPMEMAELINTIHMIDTTVDLTPWVLRAEQLRKNAKDTSLASAIKLSFVKMSLGIIKTVPDSLIKRAKPSFGNGAYWGNFSIWPDRESNILTSQMYKMLKLDSLHKDWLPRIRRYFYYELNSGNYINTYSKTALVDAIYPDLFVANRLGDPSITIKNADDSTVIRKFPYTSTIEPKGTITITKSGGRPVFITAYMERHNRKPAAVDDYFTVTSHFGDKEEIKPSQLAFLTAGKSVSLWVKVTVKKLSPYTMLEIPIPAGCSYDDNQPWGRGECYREKFKDHVAVFFSSLSPGVYDVEIKLIPRFTGRFTLNPARAELMYFPIFFGREGLKKITVR
ncbi:MAG TPA: alpha-2-macroglobulin family protein [Williamwhitmania sp.]|nr:alpha-2-macroglobulin family protein [Williamwhitmania sp.]